MRIRFSLLAALLVTFASAARAITITGFTSAANQRWTATPTHPLTGPFNANTQAAFVGLGYDFSGVGWKSTNTGSWTDLSVTLLSPLHMAQAIHVGDRYSNNTFTFQNTDGALVSRSVTGTATLTDIASSDARLVRLDKPFTPSDKVASYRLLDSGATADSVGLGTLVYGHNNDGGSFQRRIAVSNVSRVSSPFFYMPKNTVTTNAIATYVVGDSGSPTFVTYDGTLVFKGVHYGNITNEVADADWTEPTVYVGMNAAMAADGYALRWTIYPPAARAWTGATDGTFATAANWTSGNLPDATYSAVLDGAATGNRTLALSAPATVRGLLVRAAPGANPFSFSGSALTLKESGLRNEDADTLTLANPVTLGGSQNWEATAGSITVAGDIATAGHLLVLGGDQPLSLSGTLSGAGHVAWDNPGTWSVASGQLALTTGKLFVRRGTVALATAHAYSGGTFVTGGTLHVSNPSGSATGAGPVTLSSGGTLAGTGTISGSVTVQAGGNLSATLGTAPGGHDGLSLGGSLTFQTGGTLTVTHTGGATTGTYALLTATGGVTGPLPTLTCPSDWSASLQLSGNTLNLVIASTNPLAPVITAGQFAGGKFKTAFTYQLAASNSPNNYALVSGSLPTGVTLNPATGQLGGIPTATGTFTPAFTATNASATSSSVTVTLTITALKVACVGDSITAGHGLTTPQTYPAKLATALGTGYTITNYGLSGAAAMIAARSPDQSSYWSSSQFTNAKAALPDIVIFMLGTNDAKTTNDAKRGADQVNFVADYKALVDQFRNLSSAPVVYLCTPYYAAPFYTGANAFTISDTTLNTIIKPWVELIAAEKNCPLINIHGIQSGAPVNYIANDIIHPNDTGTTLIANAVAQALQNGVTPTPTLNKTTSSLAFGPLVTNWPSTLSFTLSATHLTSPLTLGVPADQGFTFKVGTGSFVNSATLTPVNGVIPMTTITVRFSPTAVQAYSTTLSLSGGGVTTQAVALSGSGVASAAPLTAYLTTPFSRTLGTLTNATYALTGGSLPPGLGLNTATGVLSGTPTQTGSYSPSFTATTTDGTYTLVQPINVAPALTAIIQESFNYAFGTNSPDPDGGANSTNGLPATNTGGSPSGTSTGLYGNWGTSTDVVAGLTYAQGAKTLVTLANAGRINNATWGTGGLFAYRFMTTDPYLSLRTGGVNNGSFGADGNTLYLSLLVSTTSTALDAARFTFNVEGGSNNLYVGITSAGTWGMDAIATGTYSNTGQAVVANTPTLLVFRFIYGTANSDTVEMWVNPALGATLGTPHATKSGVNCAFRGLVTRPAVANAMTLDEIRLGTTFSSVTPYTEAPALPAAPSGLTATAVSTSQINLNWTDNASDETGFKLERSPDGATGWIQIDAPAANSATAADTGLAPGTSYHYRIRSTNTAGDSAWSATTSATTPNGIQSFRAAHGLATDGSQDLLTPAGDGVPSLLKYAFNLLGTDVGQAPSLSTPNASVLAPIGSAGLPFCSLLPAPGSSLQLTYIRRKAASAPGVTYAVEWSDTLATWAVNPSATEAAISLDATFERVTVTDSAPSPSSRFARVRVSAP
ncbi:MAG: fibronectin type III domain-containing protein [Burkholderiales bacterium]|nr:fibronectin type III domain-containing protein [Opitutaceae bacterium]